MGRSVGVYMHVTDLCPKWLLNGEWAANRETRMCKHKEGNSGSQRVTLTRHRAYTPENGSIFAPYRYLAQHLMHKKAPQREHEVLVEDVCFARRYLSRFATDITLALSVVGVGILHSTFRFLSFSPRSGRDFQLMHTDFTGCT